MDEKDFFVDLFTSPKTSRNDLLQLFHSVTRSTTFRRDNHARDGASLGSKARLEMLARKKLPKALVFNAWQSFFTLENNLDLIKQTAGLNTQNQTRWCN